MSSNNWTYSWVKNLSQTPKQWNTFFCGLYSHTCFNLLWCTSVQPKKIQNFKIFLRWLWNIFHDFIKIIVANLMIYIAPVRGKSYKNKGISLPSKVNVKNWLFYYHPKSFNHDKRTFIHQTKERINTRHKNILNHSSVYIFTLSKQPMSANKWNIEMKKKFFSTTVFRTCLFLVFPGHSLNQTCYRLTIIIH